ncbi:hypothetical protein CBR_g42136 [Chara braunii]|uniref:Pre-mRNA-processing factor 17 n=1 Tax=Chara braunii TaxID=69332 RepID=A0A388LX69_CHABU|nr:hypothetical protein CBR_g42136 [Chara braunii]|eukprot:GBG86853.1 hypothetical protein CBR_g42136 [Chara braunii]
MDLLAAQYSDDSEDSGQEEKSEGGRTVGCVVEEKKHADVKDEEMADVSTTVKGGGGGEGGEGGGGQRRKQSDGSEMEEDGEEENEENKDKDKEEVKEGEEEEEEEEEEEFEYRPLPSKCSAPDVSVPLDGEGRVIAPPIPLDSKKRQVNFNPTYSQLWGEATMSIITQKAPFGEARGLLRGPRNHKTGFVEDSSIDPCLFDEQFHTFHAYGYAADPCSAEGLKLIGSQLSVEEHGGASVFTTAQWEHRKRRAEFRDPPPSRVQPPPPPPPPPPAAAAAGSSTAAASAAGAAEGVGVDVSGAPPGASTPGAGDGVGVDDVSGAEVAVDEELMSTLNPASDTWLDYKSPWAKRNEGPAAELTEEQRKYREEYREKKAEEKGDKAEYQEKSVFHGKASVDYQGRSWLAPPKDRKATNDHCYIPKRWVHTWSGHTKGVSTIRLFPKYGHLLLSAGMDTKIKIWDVHGSGKCMRTYMGHQKAVRDICFNKDGTKFLSAGYDRKIKLWDTESGVVEKVFGTGKIPYVVKFNPDDDKQNILLAGMSDKKIVQWDINTGEITQEYDQHLGAVNTITFVDENRRFVTSSDDKSLRVWEFGIPVVIKYISEPHMHSMPSICVHPNGNWFAAQSLDNQILVYSTRERFRLNKKKRFAGHLCAGYACQVNFSPDGRFLMSGDAEGRCWFWDWKTCKVFRTLKAHEGVCIGCEWHPLEQSKVVTCGWDGLIKYWD